MLEKIKQEQHGGDDSVNVQIAEVTINNIKEDRDIKEQQLKIENYLNVDSPQVFSTLTQNHVYELSVNNIDQELKIISEILSSINLFYPYECLDSIRNIPFVKGAYDKIAVSNIYSGINRERNRLHSNNVKLHIQTTIYANCITCKNQEICPKSTCRMQFTESYNRLYSLLFSILNALHEYLNVMDNNTLLESIIMSNKRIIELSTNDHEKEQYRLDIVTREKNKEDITPYLKTLSDCMKELNNTGHSDMNTMIIASKQYIYYKKDDAKKAKNGEIILDFISIDD